MKKLLWVACAVALLALPAHSASYRTFGQLTVDNTAGGVALTASVISPSGLPQMQHCLMRAETAELRYRVDGGSPTTTVGTVMEPLEVLTIDTSADLNAFRAIRTGGTSATLDLNCWY